MLVSNGTATALPAIGYADATPQFANSLYYPNNGMALTGNQYAAYGQIYKSSIWVAALVNKVAYAEARLPLKVYRRTDSGRTEQRDSPYSKLLRNPNRKHDPFFFWLWTRSTFEIYGEALWVKVRPAPGLPPTELWPVHPSNVSTRREADGSLTYLYYAGAAAAPVMAWPEWDVVHFKSYNPESQVRGMSRLEPLRSTILNENAAQRASQAWWSNGARPSMTLTHPGTLSPDALIRLKAQWDSNHSGVDNWAKTAILEEGMTPHVIPLSANEMQWIDARKLNREEACGIFDVPPPVVHILDRATFSNITEQMRSMYRDTMAPRLGMDESVLDTQLRPDFDPTGDLYAEFLLDEVLRGDFDARVKNYETAIRSGWLMPGEARTLENLPDAGPDSHKLYLNAATVPMGTVIDVTDRVGGNAVEASPQRIKSAQVLCHSCDGQGPFSSRGLCRSCEGRLGAAKARMKEITP
jgi:HK97 family phage portal protein